MTRPMYAPVRFRTGLLLVALLLGVGAAQAQSLGKITGRITDSETGEALVGANVIIKGTAQGASTDLDGNYFILQVAPGTHDLVVSYIGYQTKTVTGVEVRPDLTTRLDVKLASDTYQGEEVVVTADQGMVQPDVTFTRRSTSREEMDAAPGISSTADIFKLEGGAVVDGPPTRLSLDGGTQLQVRDESLKNVHIRGGRGGEILYMVDGMPVTHPIYGGRSVLELSVTDVEGMELLTGAFSAEYGQAQSGVIKITTRSGGERFNGGVKYKTDAFELGGESYSNQYTTFWLGGPEPLTQKLLPRLGVRLPGELAFFLSGSTDMTNTPYDNRRDRGTFSLLGLDLTEKQDNQANLNAKLNYQITPRLETILSYHGSWKQWSSFDWLWKDHPNNTAAYNRDNHSANFHLRHTLSNATFYQLSLGYLGVGFDASYNGMEPGDFWTIERDAAGQVVSARSNILAPQVDPRTGFYDSLGVENIWRDDVTHSFTARGDLTSQLNAEHLVKTGFEVRYHDLQYIDIQGGGLQLSDYGRYVYGNGPEVPAPPGPFKEFGQHRWVFYAQPVEASAYVQDKFEQRGLIINVGARMDAFMPGGSIMQDAYQEQWEAATGLTADWQAIKYKVSPRFGISFPISVNTVLFFSYGHFNQLPELQFFYRDPYSGGLTGNPHLDYEQTILYEFGFTHQFSKNWALDIKSYNKDISRQIGTTALRAYRGLPVHLYDNNGYARARGVEFKLNKRYAHYTSGEVTYTMQWATGYSSSAFDDYIRSVNDFPHPIRERRLGWDVRHQVVFNGMLMSPRGEPLQPFGLRLPGNWELTMLARFSSGQPYTPGTNDPILAQVLENTSTGPISMSTDLKFRKRFAFAGTTASVFAEAFNVFNQHNTQIGFGFNPWSGQPYLYGDVIQDTAQLFGWYEMFRMMDPRQFSTGRNVHFGVQLDW